jgi:hypothetical protein
MHPSDLSPVCFMSVSAVSMGSAVQPRCVEERVEETPESFIVTLTQVTGPQRAICGSTPKDVGERIQWHLHVMEEM